MKFILIYTFFSISGDINFTAVTDYSFETFDECEVHEMYYDSSDTNFALMCIEEERVDAFIEEAYPFSK